MARRTRLNLGFLWKIALVVLVAGGSIAAVWKLHRPHNPAPYIQAGDEAMKSYDFVTAAANYEVACSLLPQREDLHLKLAKCYLQLMSSGVDKYADATNEYTRAAELNPNDPVAWAGLLDVNEFVVVRLEGHAKDSTHRQDLSRMLGMMRDASQHLGKLQPDSIQAQAAFPILTVRSWILNLHLPESAEERAKPADKRKTDEQLAMEAMATLNTLMAAHPEYDKIPYWLARAKIFQGQERMRNGHGDEALPFYTDVATQFDASIAARPDVVDLYLEKAGILTALRDLDTRPNNDYPRRLHETLAKAQELVDPLKGPEDYERAKLLWADNLGRTDVTGAEDVYRKLIETFPDHLYTRLQLSSLLEHANRQQDALTVLDTISKLTGPPVTELTRREQWDLWVATSRLLRANIEIDQFVTTPPGDARDKLGKDILASLDLAKKKYDGTSKLLRVLGRYQLVNGQVRDAIDTLTSAAEKMGAEGGSVDYELLRNESTAYAMGGQANKAVDLLQRAMMDPVVANNSEIHLTLAQMNIQNQDYAKAKPYIDWLVARLPHDPQVIRLEIQELGPDPAWEKVKPLFDDLPEKTIPDVATKANAAMALKNSDESIRLLTIVNKDDPGNIAVAVNLSNYLQLAGKTADARTVIQACIDKNPNDPMLPSKLVALAPDSTPDTISVVKLEGINKIADPFARETAIADFYRRSERPEDELTHLLKAQELQPNNIPVLSTLFSIYLESNRFVEAQAMIPHMAELDCDMCHGVMLRCKLALAMNDIPAAVQYGRQMTQVESNFADSWEMYGEALQASGDLSLACEQYQSALLLQATNTKAMTNLIKCNVALGKLPAAESYLAKECQRYPNNTTFRDMRQRFIMLYRDAQSVLPELNDQIQQHPDELVGYVMDIEALKACVRREASQGNADAADQYQKQVRERYQQATEKWPDDLQIASGFADSYLQANDVANAEKILKTIANRPRWKNEPRPLIMLGQVYLAAHNFPLAEETLKAAQRLQPNSVEALLNLAVCMQYQGRMNDAVAVLVPGLSNFAIRAKYTQLLLSMPDHAGQADLEVSDAMSAQPGNRALINLMLEVYYTEAIQGISGKRDQGIKLATDSLNSDHSNVYAYLWRGKLLAIANNPDLDAASTDLAHFLDAVPNYPDAHAIYARILDAKNDRQDAIRELQTALKLAPNEKPIRLYLLSDLLGASPPQTVEAERLLQSTLALPEYAHDPDFETKEALLLATKGDEKDKAVRLIQQAVKDAGDKNNPGMVPAAMIPDYFRVLMLTKNYDLLLSESDKYVALPSTPWYVFCDRGVAKATQDDIVGATADFTTALDKAGAEPGCGPALLVVSTIVNTPKLGPAKATEMVLPRSQNSTLWQIVAADRLKDQGDLVAARKQIEQALDGLDHLNPQDKVLAIQLAADLYMNASPPDPVKATVYFRKLLELQPNDINTLNNMACMLLDHDPSQALVYSQKAYDLSLKKGGGLLSRIADTQGWVLIQNGKLPEGIQVLHSAEDVQYGETDFPEVHYHLGMGYMLKHEPAAALSDLTKARELINQAKDAHQLVDDSLAAKVETAIIQANQAVQAKNNGKPAS